MWAKRLRCLGLSGVTVETSDFKTLALIAGSTHPFRTFGVNARERERVRGIVRRKPGSTGQSIGDEHRKRKRPVARQSDAAYRSQTGARFADASGLSGNQRQVGR